MTSLSPSSLQPLRCLRHPLWLGALLLLVVNDHILKAAMPGWLTGKLSDFAGPVVAAVLLAVLVRVRTRRGWILSHMVVGLGFGAINLFPVVARWLETAMAYTPLPWSITVDPTDLIGLVMLPISFSILGKVASTQTGTGVAWRRMSQRLVIAVSAMACMATSYRDPCFESGTCEPPPCTDCETQRGAIAVGNDTSAARLVRVRPLKSGVEIDCIAVLADPGRALSRELFDAASTWLLDPSRALALSNGVGDCTAYLIETEGMPATVLAWNRSMFPEGWVSSSTEDRLPSLALIYQAGDEFLGLEHEAAHPLLAPTPGPAECEVPAQGIEWSDIPSSADGFEISDIQSSPDGCHVMSFVQGADFVLCTGIGLPFSPSEVVQIHRYTGSANYQLAQGVEVISDTTRLVAARGSYVELGPGTQSSLEPFEGCPLQHDDCGNSVRPARLFLTGPDFGDPSAEAGESIELPGAELHVVRAQEMPAIDTLCTPSTDGLDYLEYVLIENLGE